VLDLFVVLAVAVAWGVFVYSRKKPLEGGVPPGSESAQYRAPCDLSRVKCLLETLDPEKDAELIEAIVRARVLAELPQSVRDKLK
jgi:hypothetical protein